MLSLREVGFSIESWRKLHLFILILLLIRSLSSKILVTAHGSRLINLNCLSVIQSRTRKRFPTSPHNTLRSELTFWSRTKQGKECRGRSLAPSMRSNSHASQWLKSTPVQRNSNLMNHSFNGKAASLRGPCSVGSCAKLLRHTGLTRIGWWCTLAVTARSTSSSRLVLMKLMWWCKADGPQRAELGRTSCHSSRARCAPPMRFTTPR